MYYGFPVLRYTDNICDLNYIEDINNSAILQV